MPEDNENKEEKKSSGKSRKFIAPPGGGGGRFGIGDVIRPDLGTTPDRVSTPLRSSQAQPGLGESIKVGQYSGKLLGSSPIFVGTGGYFPSAAIETQKAAADEQRADIAAKEQQLMQQQLDFEMPERPDLEDKRFQQRLNDKFHEEVEKSVQESKQRYGPRWASALKSEGTEIGRRFKQRMNNLDTVAANFDQFTKLASKIEEDRRTTKEKLYSEETHQILDQFKRKVGAFEGGRLVNLAKAQNLLESSVNLDNYLNDSGIIDDLSANVTQTLQDVEGAPFGSKERQKIVANNVNELAERQSTRLKENQFKYDENVSKEDIKNRIIDSMEGKYEESIAQTYEPDEGYAATGDAPTPEDVSLGYDKKMFEGGTSWVSPSGSSDVWDSKDTPISEKNIVAPVQGAPEESITGADVAVSVGGNANSDDLRRWGQHMSGQVTGYVRDQEKGKDYMEMKADLPADDATLSAAKDIEKKTREISDLRMMMQGADESRVGQIRSAIDSKKDVIRRLKREGNFKSSTVYLNMDGDHYAEQYSRRPNVMKKWISEWNMKLSPEVQQAIGAPDSVTGNELVNEYDVSWDRVIEMLEKRAIE